MHMHPLPVRKFHLFDLLNLTTGALFPCENRYEYPMQAIYDLLDYVEGHNHYTHELLHAANRVESILLAQHPWLAEIVIPEYCKGSENLSLLMEWAREKVTRYGEWHEVKPSPSERQMPPEESARQLLNEIGNPARIIGVRYRPGETEYLEEDDDNV